jgi:dihydroorotase-like cyclic amidohydrolase
MFTTRINFDFNIFEGMTCHGVAEYVMTNGHVVLDEGQVSIKNVLKKRLLLLVF